jgi:SSS family solute:Na+ symporter
MAMPAIVGAFFWRRATAAGALGSMVIGAALVLALQLTGYKPLGMWPGVWGLIVCLVLFIGISMGTAAPRQKAEEFIGYLEKTLPRHRFI